MLTGRCLSLEKYKIPFLIQSSWSRTLSEDRLSRLSVLNRDHLTCEQVTRARLLTHIRSSRFLSAEDLIFLIRDDRGKVNRLRTYLSWKDVRKKVKEDNEDGGDVDVDEAGTLEHTLC